MSPKIKPPLEVTSADRSVTCPECIFKILQKYDKNIAILRDNLAKAPVSAIPLDQVSP